MNVSTDHIYEGKVIGDRNSYVFGSLLNGVFEGKIITERDAYYVEHAKRYFPNNFTTIQHNEMLSINNTTTTDVTNTPTLPSVSLQLQQEKEQETTTIKPIISSTSSTFSSSSGKLLPSLAEDDLIRNVGFHSVIYKDSHVDDVYENVREEGKCIIYPLEKN